MMLPTLYSKFNIWFLLVTNGFQISNFEAISQRQATGGQIYTCNTPTSNIACSHSIWKFKLTLHSPFVKASSFCILEDLSTKNWFNVSHHTVVNRSCLLFRWLQRFIQLSRFTYSTRAITFLLHFSSEGRVISHKLHFLAILKPIVNFLSTGICSWSMREWYWLATMAKINWRSP